MHIHTREDEMFYLLDGQVSITVDGATTEATSGYFVHIPRGVPHGYRNVGNQAAKMLAVFTPAGMEGWFEEALMS